MLPSHPRLGYRVDGIPFRVGDQVPDSRLLGSTSGHGMGSVAASLTHICSGSRVDMSVGCQCSPGKPHLPPRGTLGYNRVGLRQQARSEMHLDWDRSWGLSSTIFLRFQANPVQVWSVAAAWLYALLRCYSTETNSKCPGTLCC